jgi:hypothetical protein
MDNFVVYAYCRKNGTFYYIGKGQPTRPFVKRRKGVNRPKDRSKILILHQNLSENTAFDYERKLILFYGRKDLGTGLLRNRTDGGEGASGWIISKTERERRTKENYFLGRRFIGESNPMYGKERPDLAVRNKEKPPAKDTLWFNNGIINKRCTPGEEPEGFIPGRINAKPNTWAAGRQWFHNNSGETRMCFEPPGPDWKPGRKT